MAVYGSPVEDMAISLAPLIDESKNPTQEVAFHLAMAFAYMQRIDTKDIRVRPLVVDRIREAWRELLYVHFKKWFDDGVTRKVSLSKTGAVMLDNSVGPGYNRTVEVPPEFIEKEKKEARKRWRKLRKVKEEKKPFLKVFPHKVR